jgi:hypothetical protein
MAIESKIDYMFSPKVKTVTDDFTLIGTKEYVFAYPIKTSKVVSQMRGDMEEMEHFIKGEIPYIYFEKLLNDQDMSLEKLIEICRSHAEQQQGANLFKISDFKKFKVSAGFFGSQVYLANKIFDANIYTGLGKNKKDWKAFYN